MCRKSAAVKHRKALPKKERILELGKLLLFNINLYCATYMLYIVEYKLFHLAFYSVFILAECLKLMENMKIVTHVDIKAKFYLLLDHRCDLVHPHVLHAEATCRKQFGVYFDHFHDHRPENAYKNIISTTTILISGYTEAVARVVRE